MRKVLPKKLLEQSKQQSWKKIKIVEGLPEGKGVFATENLERGTFVCNYGVFFLKNQYCEKYLLPFDEKCEFLIEMEENCNGILNSFYLNHDQTTAFTFGKYLNHSVLHPNLECRTFAVDDDALDVLFITTKKVKENDQLVWNYGPNYTGVGSCVKSCSLCKRNE